MILTTSRFSKVIRTMLSLCSFLLVTGPREGLADTVMSTTTAGAGSSGQWPASMAGYMYQQSLYPSAYLSGSRGLSTYPASYYGYPYPYMYGYGTPTYYLKEATRASPADENSGQCVNWDLKQNKQEDTTTTESTEGEGSKGKSASEEPSFQARQSPAAPFMPLPLIPLSTPLRTIPMPGAASPFGHAISDLSRGFLLGGPARSPLPTLIPVVLPLLSQATRQMSRQHYPGSMMGSSMMQQQQQQQQQQQTLSGGYSTGMGPFYGQGFNRPVYYGRSTSATRSSLENSPLSNLFYEFANAVPALWR